ncbi:MAG: hypothetical protein PWP27_2469 [Clostridiales bacterium]|nr:hypothetical protein [Clostridiales bacterium]
MRTSDKKLIGEFEVEDEMILIFDFNKNDDSKINKDITPELKVKVTELAYTKFFD